MINRLSGIATVPSAPLTQNCQQKIREGFVKIEIFGENLAIHFAEIGPSDGPALVCLHKNSGNCKDFYTQFHALGDQYRVIAFDLPGHGQSTPVISNENKAKIYSFPGYASAMAKAIKAMNLNNFFVLGISLGGHNALSFLAMQNSPNADPEVKEIANKIKGVILSGTPPLDLSLTDEASIMGEFTKGFNCDFMEKLPQNIRNEMHELGISHLSALIGLEKNLNDGSQESNRLAEFFIIVPGIDLSPETQFMVEAVKNTRGEARKHMMNNMLKGSIDNQRATVEGTHTPLLIIAGADDIGINLNYLKTLNLSSVGRLKILPGQHGVFLENSFNEEVKNFLVAIK